MFLVLQTSVEVYSFIEGQHGSYTAATGKVKRDFACSLGKDSEEHKLLLIQQD